MRLLPALLLVFESLLIGNSVPAQDVCPPDLPNDYEWEFRVFGTSDGSGYSWCINADAYSVCDSNVAVPAGASAHDVAVALAASIAAQCSNVTASVFLDRFHFQLPYMNGHPENWPTLCLGRAGEAPTCCIPGGGQICVLDVEIENYNYSCKCGDADHSMFWSISDVVFLINYIFAGGPAPRRTCEGDADGNQVVTISDAIYIIGFIFVGAPAPAGC